MTLEEFMLSLDYYTTYPYWDYEYPCWGDYRKNYDLKEEMLEKGLIDKIRGPKGSTYIVCYRLTIKGRLLYNKLRKGKA